MNAQGELLTTQGDYDLVEFNELAVTNTAYNFFAPRAGKQFVITGLLAFADKQVSPTTNATVEIYEADSITSTTVDKSLLKFELGQNQQLPFPSLRLLVNKGVYINAKTDDDDIHMNIIGHYINIIEQDETI